MIELQTFIFKTKEPFIGGVNLVSFATNLFFPYTSILSKIFPYQNVMSTGFGWWESFAFIGPFSIFGFYFIIKSAFEKRKKEISILIILSILFLFLSTPNSPLNPIHYLISYSSLLQYFHVPARILLFWGIIILVGFGIFIDDYKNKKVAITILLSNLLLVFIFSQNVLLSQRFPTIDSSYNAALSWIGKNNTNNYSTLGSSSQGLIPQDIAYNNHILLLQSNYGLFLKGSPAQENNFRGMNPYKGISPGYILFENATKSAELKFAGRFGKNIYLFQGLNSVSFAKVGEISSDVRFSPDKILIKTNSNGKNTLSLFEMNYPGWEAYVDGKKIRILNKKFLEVQTLPGSHLYEFKFYSKTFGAGLFVSILSFSIWLLVLLKKSIINTLFLVSNNRNIVCKKRA